MITATAEPDFECSADIQGLEMERNVDARWYEVICWTVPPVLLNLYKILNLENKTILAHLERRAGGRCCALSMGKTPPGATTRTTT